MQKQTKEMSTVFRTKTLNSVHDFLPVDPTVQAHMDPSLGSVHAS